VGPGLGGAGREPEGGPGAPEELEGGDPGGLRRHAPAPARAGARARGHHPPDSGTLLAIEAEGPYAQAAQQGSARAQPAAAAASAACQAALLELLSSEHAHIIAALSLPRSFLLGPTAGAPSGSQGGGLLMAAPGSAMGYGPGASPQGQGQIGGSPLTGGRQQNQQHLLSPSGSPMVYQSPMAAPGLLGSAGTAPPALSTSLASLRCASGVLFFARTVMASLSSRPMDCMWPLLSLGLQGGRWGAAGATLLNFHDAGDPALAGPTGLIADVAASCSALLELLAEVGSPLPFGRSPAALSLKVHIIGHEDKARASLPSSLGCSGGWFGAAASALAGPGGRDNRGSGTQERLPATGTPAKVSPEQQRPSPGAPGLLRSSLLSSPPSFGSPRGKLGRRSLLRPQPHGGAPAGLPPLRLCGCLRVHPGRPVPPPPAHSQLPGRGAAAGGGAGVMPWCARLRCPSRNSLHRLQGKGHPKLA